MLASRPQTRSWHDCAYQRRLSQCFGFDARATQSRRGMTPLPRYVREAMFRLLTSWMALVIHHWNGCPSSKFVAIPAKRGGQLIADGAMQGHAWVLGTDMPV
eukprot:1883341-Amphidinium_carterae.1